MSPRVRYGVVSRLCAFLRLLHVRNSYVASTPNRMASLFVFRILDHSATGLDTLSMSCKEFGHMLAHQKLCSHEILRSSHKSVQTDHQLPYAGHMQFDFYFS